MSRSKIEEALDWAEDVFQDIGFETLSEKMALASTSLASRVLMSLDELGEIDRLIAHAVDGLTGHYDETARIGLANQIKDNWESLREGAV